MYQTAPIQSQREITSELEDAVPKYDGINKSELLKNGNRLTAIFYESGIVLTLRRRQHHFWRNWLSWNVRVPSRFKGQTRGLCGLFDGNRNNDFITREGVQLQNSISHKQLYNFYVNSCKLHAISQLLSAHYIIILLLTVKVNYAEALIITLCYE